MYNLGQLCPEVNRLAPKPHPGCSRYSERRGTKVLLTKHRQNLQNSGGTTKGESTANQWP